jgi:hypothetical protein
MQILNSSRAAVSRTRATTAAPALQSQRRACCAVRAPRSAAPCTAAALPAAAAAPRRVAYTASRRRAVRVAAGWGDPVTFTPAKVVSSKHAADQLHKVLIDVGADIAAGYTKGGQYVQVKVGGASGDCGSVGRSLGHSCDAAAVILPLTSALPLHVAFEYDPSGRRLQARVFRHCLPPGPQQSGWVAVEPGRRSSNQQKRREAILDCRRRAPRRRPLCLPRSRRPQTSIPLLIETIS